MINPILLEKIVTKEKYKILATNEKWIHVFQIHTGKIDTVSCDNLKDHFIVVIPQGY